MPYNISVELLLSECNISLSKRKHPQVIHREHTYSTYAQYKCTTYLGIIGLQVLGNGIFTRKTPSGHITSQGERAVCFIRIGRRHFVAVAFAALLLLLSRLRLVTASVHARGIVRRSSLLGCLLDLARVTMANQCLRHRRLIEAPRAQRS
jgi:hypothetical protein